MFELIYAVSAVLYFVVLKLVTTYGYTERETSYYSSSRERNRFKRLSEMPLPRLVLFILIGFIPVANTASAVIGFVYAAANGFGPTTQDVTEWFRNRAADRAAKKLAKKLAKIEAKKAEVPAE